MSCVATCNTASVATKPDPAVNSHKGLFYLNDFSYLDDPEYRDHRLGDSLKRLSVGPCGQWGTVDIGGHARLRYHDERGMGRQPGRAGFEDTTNTFLLSRIRLYGDWRASEDVRVYVEGITADETGNGLYQPRPIDVNYGDLLNAFIDLRLAEELTLRVGRQELLYGNQRLVSPLDWANTRRTFEGVRGLYQSGDLAIDGFYTNFVPVDPGNFDEADYDQSFYGVYSVYSGWEKTTIDLYYLGYDDERNLPSLFSDFSLHTLGARFYGPLGEKFLYEVEGGYQFGRRSGLGIDQDAGFATVGLGRAFDHHWSPTVWCYYDYASGNAVGGDFNRFNHLFPLAHKYLGFIDSVARENIESPNVLVTFKPHERWNLLVWYYYLIANQPDDNIPGVAFPANQRITSDDFGQELDLIATYQIAPRSSILFGYSHLWGGNRILGERDIEFFYAEWTLNF
jgi:hypothetical protein